MEKSRKYVEQRFNQILRKQELSLRIYNCKEITLYGFPERNFLSRSALTSSGILMLIITLSSSDGYESILTSTFSIGGTLLGIILALTPSISFYSKKNFKLHISQKTKCIRIKSGLLHWPEKFLFSQIDGIVYKKTVVRDLVDGSKTFSYHYSLLLKNKHIQLATLIFANSSMEAFTLEFAEFLGHLINKEVRAYE